MSDSPDQGERLERQHGYHLSTEVSSDDIDNRDHQKTNDHVTFKGREGHLLTEVFELPLNRCDFFGMSFVLGFDDMGIFEFFEALVKFFDFAWMDADVLLLSL